MTCSKVSYRAHLFACCSRVQLQPTSSPRLRVLKVTFARRSRAVTAATTRINIPSTGSPCHWAVAPTLTIPAGTGTLEILGAGTTTGTAKGCGTCGTVIIDDVAGTDTMMQINHSGATARVAGFSMTRGTGGLKAQGFFKLFGSANQVRLSITTRSTGAAGHSSIARWSPARPECLTIISGRRGGRRGGATRRLPARRAGL